ncbi:MAG: hypothetical protein ACK555_04580 [Acidobacteriota bacterium]
MMSSTRERGTALLAVLWLTAALSAIAFSVADTVRAETERAIASQESVRSYYLARGAVQRILFLLRNEETMIGSPPAERFAGRRRFYFREEFGDTFVELLSEGAKLPLRGLHPQLLANLLVLTGENEVSAQQIARQAFNLDPVGMMALGENFAAPPAFRPSIASMENVEELLLLPGITSEMVYGRYARMPDGNLVNLGGLVDYLSGEVVKGGARDALSTHPSLLMLNGMPAPVARQMAEIRRSSYDLSVVLGRLAQAGIPFSMDLGDVFQIRATGRFRLPDGRLSATRRTVALTVKYTPVFSRYVWVDPWTNLRWNDQSYSETAAADAVWLEGALRETRN